MNQGTTASFDGESLIDASNPSLRKYSKESQTRSQPRSQPVILVNDQAQAQTLTQTHTVPTFTSIGDNPMANLAQQDIELQRFCKF